VNNFFEKFTQLHTPLTLTQAGAAPGLEIWRIHNKRTANDTADFGLERVPPSEYRKFYRGDSYVLLYTYKEADSDALCFNVHFWIGSESSQDEYGVRVRQRDSGKSKRDS
jgi:hypothetical protein